ncbi:MAG: prepilin-type N-terminal cleavage/methylation domain-containing protein [Actinomycetota bacterium]
MRVRSDRGFTVVELIVAMGIAAILVSMLGSVLGAALTGARISRDYQTASGVGSEQLEQLRALPWPEVAMASVDGGAPLLTSGGTALDGAEAGLPADEALVVAEGGVAPRVEEAIDGTVYVGWRYVSEAGDGVRRLTVVVEWVGPSGSHDFSVSTLVSELTAGGFGPTTTIPPATTTSTTA